MGFNLPLLILRRRLLGSAAFTPATLFSFGEQGVWFDPSDVANLDWRRNLFTYTEQFENSAWGKGANVTISSTSVTAPDGTATARMFSVSGLSDVSANRIAQTPTTSSGDHVFSVWMRSTTSQTVRVKILGTSGTVVGATLDVAVTSTWTRFQIAATGLTANAAATIGPSGAALTNIEVWGAQLELGSVATTYQPITDVNAEARALFPNATLYQDSVGTTLVTTPGQPVGLMLDRSRGLALGSELVTNGDFSSGTGWTLGTGWAVSGGQATFTATGANSALTTVATAAAVSGRTYEIRYTVVSNTLNAGTLRLGAFSSGSYSSAVQTLPSTVGNQIFRFQSVPSGAGTVLDFWVTSAATSGSITIDNISVKELAGNHAVQATSANRPIYGIEPQGGRRNLLTFTEQLDNVNWTKLTGVTATATQVTFASGGATEVLRRFFSFASGQAYTVSFDARSISGNTSLSLDLSNVETQSVTLTTTSQRFTWTTTPAAARTWLDFQLGGAGVIELTNIQFETGSTATNYQRVTDQYNVTEAGVPPVSYLFFNGNNFSMSTPSINFPAGPTNPTLDAELVTNGGFDSGITGWSAGNSATITWVSGAIRIARNGVNNPFAHQSFTTVIGRTYRVGFNLKEITGATATVRVGTSAGNDANLNAGVLPLGNGSRLFVATATTTFVSLFFGATADDIYADFDNISVRELDAAQAPNKMTVFAGLRFSAPASNGTAFETSVAADGNAGAFYLRQNAGGLSQYQYLTRGSSTNASVVSSYTPPVAHVVSGLSDIGAALLSFRVNGAQVGSSNVPPGATSYLAYPLYIGARAGSTLFFSGNLYSLIVRGAQSTTTQITETETWVAGETGFFVPAISGVPTVGIS
jgi:hypothetical protein